MLLSITMTCYDVFGGLAPITIVLKINLRRLNNLGWDTEVSEETKQQWVKILTKLKEAEVVTFKRCVRPANSVGQPVLIISTDGSDLAMCATAHVRWECSDGTVDCRLWLARTRVAPIKKLTTPRIELQAAVMGVRLSNYSEELYLDVRQHLSHHRFQVSAWNPDQRNSGVRRIRWQSCDRDAGDNVNRSVSSRQLRR